jgi:hypothetical protein
MTTPTLIERLRTDPALDGTTLGNEAADVIEAQAAEIDRLKNQTQLLLADCNNWAQEVKTERRLSFREERDALKTELAALKAQEPVAYGAFLPDGILYSQCKSKVQIEEYVNRIHQSSDSITLNVGPIYASPVAPVVEATYTLVGYINFDDIENMLEDRTAVVEPKKSGICKTALYKKEGS